MWSDFKDLAFIIAVTVAGVVGATIVLAFFLVVGLGPAALLAYGAIRMAQILVTGTP